MLLSVRNLATQFLLDEGVLRAVDDVRSDVAEEETVALVGESGCGKRSSPSRSSTSSLCRAASSRAGFSSRIRVSGAQLRRNFGRSGEARSA